MPGAVCPVDMPDDYFRVRLVCVLLDTCGMCFDRGTQQKKLDNFLVFFQVCQNPSRRHDFKRANHHEQMYTLCKDPIPMDVEFMLGDSLEVGQRRFTFFIFLLSPFP